MAGGKKRNSGTTLLPLPFKRQSLGQIYDGENLLFADGADQVSFLQKKSMLYFIRFDGAFTLLFIRLQEINLLYTLLYFKLVNDTLYCTLLLIYLVYFYFLCKVLLFSLPDAEGHDPPNV